MYQMIPVEQFLDRYAFVTGTGYSQHYAQIIRTAGGGPRAGRRPDRRRLLRRRRLRGRRLADQPRAPTWPRATQAFGILNVGYTGVTSYAYPGGLKLAVINPQ
jgi:hypothetical protein